MLFTSVVRRWGLTIALAGAITVMLSLSATAWAADSVLTPSPSSWDFGSSDVHFGRGRIRTSQISNDTGPTSRWSSVELTGADADQFQLGSDGCTGNAFLCPGQLVRRLDHSGPLAPEPRRRRSSSPTATMGCSTSRSPAPGMTGTLTANPDPLVFNTQPYFFGRPDAERQHPELHRLLHADIVGLDRRPRRRGVLVCLRPELRTALFVPNGGNSCGMGISSTRQRPVPSMPSSTSPATAPAARCACRCRPRR